MHRITISRDEFHAAIEHGINAAAPMAPEVVRKLRKLAYEAKTVSGNYHGCPLTRVIGYDRAVKHDTPGAALFINGYDEYLVQRTDAWKQYLEHDWQVVTNKHGEEIIFIKD